MNRSFLLLLMTCMLAVVGVASAQTPDSSYAVNAVCANTNPYPATCTAQQADGSTIVGASGAFGLYRFTSSGVPDTTFGIAGLAYIVFDTGSYSGARVSDVVVQPDGKILAVGSATYCLPALCGVMYLMCARFLPSGVPDSTFGTFGYLRSDVFFPPTVGMVIQTSALSKVRLLPGGKMLFAGMAQHVAGGNVIQGFIARYNSDGTPDITYGSSGFSWLANLARAPTDMYLYPDHSVVTVANCWDPHWYVGLYKIDSNGAPVTGFGTGGVDTFNNNVNGYPYAMSVRPDGKIILLGNLLDTAGYYAGVVTILNSDGGLSTVIPGGHSTVILPGHWTTTANSILVEAGNKLFITGTVVDISTVGYDTSTAFVCRLNSNGSFDTSYYGCGYKLFVHQPDSGYLWSISAFNWANVLPGGKILVVGSIGQVTPINALVAGMFIMRFSNAPTAIPDANGKSVRTPVVYPNPTAGELIINCNDLEYSSFYIADNIGRILSRGELQQTTHLDIRSLPPGVYIIRLSGNEGSTALQFTRE